MYLSLLIQKNRTGSKVRHRKTPLKTIALQIFHVYIDTKWMGGWSAWGLSHSSENSWGLTTTKGNRRIQKRVKTGPSCNLNQILVFAVSIYGVHNTWFDFFLTKQTNVDLTLGVFLSNKKSWWNGTDCQTKPIEILHGSYRTPRKNANK